MGVRILDVTLRDGGIVNNFEFGEKNMKRILSAIEDSGVDFIELGYLEKNTGTVRGRSQFINEKVIPRYFLTKKKPGVTYSVMFDYGKFDVDVLGNREKNGIDAIRFAFHKRDFSKVKPIYEKLIQKGYETYMQPMITLHYTDEELKELVALANCLNIKGLYFVDTFGQMHQSDIERLSCFFDRELRKDIALGFHSHNNMQMAFANTIAFLQYKTERNKMIDSSVMGMGRGAGNLNTEMILQYLNLYYGIQYDIHPLLKVMDSILNKIKAQYTWGYSAEYYLSAINDCSPVYAGHYYKKHMLQIEQINELLGMIKGEKRISFDKEYAEEIYRQYNARRNREAISEIEKLRSFISGKKICVLAPGKSLLREKEKVMEAINHVDLTVSINCSVFNSDIIMVTRDDAIEKITIEGNQIIVTSNVNICKNDRIFVIDYLRWISIIDGETQDSAGYIILNLLIELGVVEIYLAGFDGFTSDINENYFEDSLKRPVTADQLDTKNKLFAEFIKRKKNEASIKFITSSMYEWMVR